jgi:hypothetical protein
MRKFLRYEISGLLITIYTLLIILCFINNKNSLSLGELIKTFLQPLAIASTVVALPMGYLIYQCYDGRWNPHYHTKSFHYIKDSMKMTDECCLALIDFILKDLMFKRYQGYADTIRGFWDNYDARFIIGKIVPSISILLAFIALVVIYFSFSDYFILPSGIKIVYLIMLFAYLLISSYIVFESTGRIKKQVEAQEFFLLYSQKDELDKFKNEFLKDPNFAECMDS